MLDTKAEIVQLARLLTPEHQAELLAWVRLAYQAENAVKKPLHKAADRAEGKTAWRTERRS